MTNSDHEKARLLDRLRKGLLEGIAHSKGKLKLVTTELPVPPPKPSHKVKKKQKIGQIRIRPTMKQSAIVILSLLSFVTASHAAVEVRLTPLPAAAITAEGFIPAVLTVADPNGELPRAARALAIRRLAGGPTMFYETSMAPGATGSFRVLLPMVSVRETYVVRLLAEASPTAPAVLRRDVTAETDNVAAVEAARDKLIDPPAYDAFIEDLPRWPTWVTRSIFLAAVLLLVAMGSALLIHRRGWRLAAACAVVAVASAGLYISLSQCPSVLSRRGGDILAVSCRRTATWSAPAKGVGPVYWRPQQMNQDDMVYQPDAALTVTLHPNEVRLFRCRAVDRAP